MTREWTLVIDSLGRPLLANAAKKLHPVAETKARGRWRDTAMLLAIQARIPKRLPQIDVTVQARYGSRRSPSDCDATAPSVKGVIDGLVRAGVIADDCPPYVASVTYRAPLVGTGLRDALIVTVTAGEETQ